LMIWIFRYCRAHSPADLIDADQLPVVAPERPDTVRVLTRSRQMQMPGVSDYALRMKAPRFTRSSARSLIACGPVITPKLEVKPSPFGAVIFTPPKIDIFQTDT